MTGTSLTARQHAEHLGPVEVGETEVEHDQVRALVDRGAQPGRGRPEPRSRRGRGRPARAGRRCGSRGRPRSRAPEPHAEGNGPVVPVGAPMRHPGGVRGGRGVPTVLWVRLRRGGRRQRVGRGADGGRRDRPGLGASVLSAGEVSSRLADEHPGPAELGHATGRPTGRRTSPANPAPSGIRPAGAPSPAPSGVHARRPSSTVVRTLVSRGGSVVASCSRLQRHLRIGQSGRRLRLRRVEPRPAAEAEVRFSGDSGEVKMQVTCRTDGVPTARVESMPSQARTTERSDGHGPAPPGAEEHLEGRDPHQAGAEHVQRHQGRPAHR